MKADRLQGERYHRYSLVRRTLDRLPGMKLKLTYEADSVTDYDISIGGMVQLLWRTEYQPVARLRLLYGNRGESVIAPVVHMSSDMLLAMAWPVMWRLLEASRHRYPYEDMLIYLTARWRQALQDIGIPPVFGKDEETLTADTLNRSKAMREIREGR